MNKMKIKFIDGIILILDFMNINLEYQFIYDFLDNEINKYKNKD